MEEGGFDFEKWINEIPDKGLKAPNCIRLGSTNTDFYGNKTPNSELNYSELSKGLLDELLSHLLPVGRETPLGLPRKILFGGEGTSGISSYLAGWMAGGGMDVIVLDGANAFDPYRVSSFARKAVIPPERLLKRIRIARAFTCHQMATLITEKLVSLLHPSPFRQHPRKPCVILLGPVTTFLDEDVPEREVGPLFERSLKKMEMMAGEGVPFFLFQSHAFSQHHAGKEVSKNPNGRMTGWMGAKRTYLMKRLFQFSNLAWKISLEEDEPKLILEKGLSENAGARDWGLSQMRSLQ